MKFTSLSFLLFFLVVYSIHWMLRGRFRLSFLFLASFGFYAAWSIPFALHFLALVVLNHLLNVQIQKTKSNLPYYLLLGINFGNLFLFKYFYFLWELLFTLTASPLFAEETVRGFLSSQFGFESVTLPLAISFYTFQMVAYTIDLKRGEANESPNLLQYSLFIFFFPQLVAGPIVRHGEFFYQLEVWEAKLEDLQEGLYLVFLGLLKKVVIADNLSPILQPVFQSPESYNAITNILVLFGYSARVFCDFSGYTDLARGLGKLLGIHLPENFRSPYLATSLSDLWTRWHMTLATWIKDYIYFPLGGSRVSELRGYVNLLLTFTLTGLWHGANLTFVAWGFFNGLILSLERKWKLLRQNQKPILPNGKGKLFLSICYSFCAFTFLTAFFNAPDITHSFQMYSQIFFWKSGLHLAKAEQILYSILIVIGLNFLQGVDGFPRRHWSLTQSTLFLFLFSFLVCILLGYLAPGGAEFIYFQF